MILESFLAMLLTVAICALLAFVASLLLRSPQGILGYIGAGLFGQMLGAWIASAVKGGSWPGSVTLAGSSVHLLWTFLGALIILAIFRYAPRVRRRRG